MGVALSLDLFAAPLFRLPASVIDLLNHVIQVSW